MFRYRARTYNPAIQAYAYVCLPVFFVALFIYFPLAVLIGLVNLGFLVSARLS